MNKDVMNERQADTMVTSSDQSYGVWSVKSERTAALKSPLLPWTIRLVGLVLIPHPGQNHWGALFCTVATKEGGPSTETHLSALHMTDVHYKVSDKVLRFVRRTLYCLFIQQRQAIMR